MSNGTPLAKDRTVMMSRGPSKRTSNTVISVLAGTFAGILVSAIGFTAVVPPINTKPTFRNWGISNEVASSHVRAPEAWKIEKGSSNVVVAVVDTGIDSNHPDLSPNVWRAKDGKYGWDYTVNKADPVDFHGHGTHVAGIIGAVSNPKSGIAGVAQKVSIMAVKYYSDSNSGAVNLRNTIRAIEFAVENGAKIINYSGGGPEFSQAEYLAIKKAEAKGVLFVAAAGNERQNVDEAQNFYYPSAYGLQNMISVAATDINNRLIASSNWGKKHVDVAAPGENIYSTLPGGRYGSMSGTSQATAFVTGIAALLLSKNPKLTPIEIRRLIVESADQIPGLASRVRSGGRANAYAALLALMNPAGTKLAKSSRMIVMPSLLSPGP